MKSTLLSLLTLLLCVNSYSQAYDLVNVVTWEANAKSGGLFIGIAPNKHEAQNAIDELSFIKEGTKYEIVHTEINISPILINKNTSVKDDFISEHEYLEYKYISEIELISLEYMEDDDLTMAISFYTNVVREKNKELAERHLKMLKANYSKYIFDHDPNVKLLTFIE